MVLAIENTQRQIKILSIIPSFVYKLTSRIHSQLVHHPEVQLRRRTPKSQGRCTEPDPRWPAEAPDWHHTAELHQGPGGTVGYLSSEAAVIKSGVEDGVPLRHLIWEAAAETEERGVHLGSPHRRHHGHVITLAVPLNVCNVTCSTSYPTLIKL